MKRLFFLAFLILFAGASLKAQVDDETEVYFLTCMPGDASYSVYGHSAIRIVIPSIRYDQVFNWGVFDFSTPGFAFKFAAGKLNYMLGVSTYNRFLQEYMMEQRTVYSQKINLDNESKKALFELVSENLLPENRYYLYDFFYDNCATRVRDIIEASVGGGLIYPEKYKSRKEMRSFRQLIDIYQSKMPWLDLGADMLLGMPADKKAGFREEMFLPNEMMINLSEAEVWQSGEKVPLLEDPEVVVDFTDIAYSKKFWTAPFFVFTILLVVIIWLTWFLRRKRIIKVLDIVLFGIFSLVAILMIFTNIFTDHKAMHWNFNILWLNPFIFPAFISLFRKNYSRFWFRMILFTTVLLVPALLIMPQQLNISLFPVVLILIVRTVMLADFSKPAK